MFRKYKRSYFPKRLNFRFRENATSGWLPAGRAGDDAKLWKPTTSEGGRGCFHGALSPCLSGQQIKILAKFSDDGVRTIDHEILKVSAQI